MNLQTDSSGLLTYQSTTPNRILSVDILRGIIMIIMALDHTRDFFSNYKGDPLDFEHTTLLMYFTRWVTHYCAPVFVFLSGTSAFLSMTRGRTIKQTSWILFSRGVFLLLMELTIIRFGWTFNLDYHFMVVQVIWAIGWSMIFLSVFIFLPVPVIAFIAFAIIIGHNALDNLKATDFTNPGIWEIIHQSGMLSLGDHYHIFVIYPLIPWIGVMALGYCFGVIFTKPIKIRNKWLYYVGFGTILTFIILRFTNFYGDPRPWHIEQSTRNTILDFIKCEKYPPSLLYLLMTLGPAIMIMPLLEKLRNGPRRFLSVYGRVPMFYYIFHIFLIHGMALATGLIMGFSISTFTQNGFLFDKNSTWGFSLPWVYAYWIAAVLVLYLPCRWYMHIKMKYKKWWLSYI